MRRRQRRASISTRKGSGPASPPGDKPMALDPVEAALRQLYDATLTEPVPDDFLRILDQLAETEQRGES